MMELLKKIDGFAVAPVSAGADEQNRILERELPFRVLEYKSRDEHNGWIVPQKWEVVRAEIRKDGKKIYDGKAHPLGVIGYSQSFRGTVSLPELQEHLYYKKDAPDEIVYHCDLYYKPHRKLWGFSVPYKLYVSLQNGNYDIDLQTTHKDGTMKVLEYTHKGKSRETVILNAHNCHAAQLNDGPAGYAALIDAMKRLEDQKTKYTYRLVIAPEHLGTVFYLADLPAKEVANFKFGIFTEMIGHDQPKFALQESFTGQTLIDRAAHHVLRHQARGGYWSDRFRKIVGNDETVWEAPGIEVPTISLSRCKSRDFFYPQYHLSSDNISIIREDKLREAADLIWEIIQVLERNTAMRRKFTGLIALSNPKYDLYINSGADPSEEKESRPKWNYLMDCLPRYFDGEMTVLDIAEKHDLPFDEVYDYISKFQEKGLIVFI